MFGGGFGGTPTFGTFGQTNLANKPATSTFSGTGTSLFGTSANTGGFASAAPTSNVFGQPQASSAANIFGGGFNQPKPATSNLFGAPQTNTMFGQPRLPGAGTGSIFSGNSTVATVSPFSGGAQAQPNGTSVRFDPIAGNDTMMRNGTATPISTRNQCITCMKEYENKSLEELRLEDYQLGRKGPSQNVFGGAQAQPSSSMFQMGQTPGTTSTFGQTSTFGGTNPATGGLFNQLNQPKPQTSFFGNTSTTSGPFGNSSFSFGNTATQPPAGGSLFGNTATSNTGIGSFGSFPQTSQQQQPAMSLFGNKPLTTPATSTPFLGFNTPTSSAINKPVPTFGNTTSGFGTPAQQPFGATTSLFGAPNQQQNKPFSFSSGFNQQPTSQPLFGGTSSSFSFSNPTSAPAFSSGFGNTSTTGGGFPAFGTNTTTNFGNSITNTGFGANTFSGLGTGNTSTGLSLFSNPNNSMTANLGNPNISSSGPVPFGTTPYKDSPLFYNLINNRSLDEMSKPTNPQAQRQIKEAARRKPSTSLGASSGTAIKNLTFPTPKLQTSIKDALFDGFEEEDQGSTIDILSPKTSVKKLNLKNMGFSRYSLNTSSFNASDREDRGKVPTENMNGSKLNSSQLFNGSHNISNLSVSELYPPKSVEPIVGIHESSSSESPADSFYAPVNNHNAHEKSSYLDSFDKPEDTSIDRLNDGDTNEDHPCGVKCTRVGYYLLPTVKDLDFLTDSQGNCFVKNFVIGRRNYGEIRFLDIVNVGNLDIDDIVLFRHKEVVVYPDDNNKPPVGEGINVPAEISLERVWPIDKITKDPIKVPSKIKALKYEEKLRRSCARLDAEFISYNEQKGEWVFRVKHFSKYSCAPEEEEEDDSVIEMEVAKSGLGGKTIQQLKSYAGATQALIVDEKGDSNIPELLQRNIPESIQEVPSLPAEINCGGGDEVSEEPMITLTRENGVHAPETMDIGFPSAVADYFNEDENVLNYPDYFGLADARKPRVPESVAGLITVIPSVKVPQHRRRDEISFMDARKKRTNFSKLMSYPESNYRRGVPVAFGPNGMFLHILNQSMEYPKANRFIGQIKVNKIMPHREIHNRGKAVSEVFSGSVVQQLSLVLENSCEDNVFAIRPQGIIGELVKYFTRELKSAEKIEKASSARKFGYVNLFQEELQLWKLCDILWPSEELSDAELKDEGHQIEQRIRLASWFKSNSKMLFGDEYDEDDKSLMGILKKGHHMEACELAVKQGNFNLALDLAQCCGESRRTMEVQMEEWERSEVVRLIPHEIREVYRLCTGLPVWGNINLKQMTTSQWLQHFAIYLWYMCPMHFSIEEAVIHYQTYIYDYVGDDREVEYPSRSDSSIANTCVHLFKAYVTVGYNIRNVLNPKTNNPDCLDYKLSWFLMQNLKLFGYTPSLELTEDLSVGFAGQLESLGLFEWAVFLLKTLPECEQRNIMINRVLERNVTFKDEQESRIDFLEKYLGLSRAYVREHCFRKVP